MKAVYPERDLPAPRPGGRPRTDGGGGNRCGGHGRRKSRARLTGGPRRRDISAFEILAQDPLGISPDADRTVQSDRIHATNTRPLFCLGL